MTKSPSASATKRAPHTPRTSTSRRAETVYRYTAIFEPAEEGGYVVTIPALNGLTTEGDTMEEARAMAKDAIIGYIEALQKLGEDIPLEHGVAMARRIAVRLTPT
jgi:antitoxin HicB